MGGEKEINGIFPVFTQREKKNHGKKVGNQFIKYRSGIDSNLIRAETRQLCAICISTEIHTKRTTD